PPGAEIAPAEVGVHHRDPRRALDDRPVEGSRLDHLVGTLSQIDAAWPAVGFRQGVLGGMPGVRCQLPEPVAGGCRAEEKDARVPEMAAAGAVAGCIGDIRLLAEAPDIDHARAVRLLSNLDV